MSTVFLYEIQPLDHSHTESARESTASQLKTMYCLTFITYFANTNTHENLQHKMFALVKRQYLPDDCIHS